MRPRGDPGLRKALLKAGCTTTAELRRRILQARALGAGRLA